METVLYNAPETGKASISTQSSPSTALQYLDLAFIVAILLEKRFPETPFPTPLQIHMHAHTPQHHSAAEQWSSEAYPSLRSMSRLASSIPKGLPRPSPWPQPASSPLHESSPAPTPSYSSPPIQTMDARMQPHRHHSTHEEDEVH